MQHFASHTIDSFLPCLGSSRPRYAHKQVFICAPSSCQLRHRSTARAHGETSLSGKLHTHTIACRIGRWHCSHLTGVLGQGTLDKQDERLGELDKALEEFLKGFVGLQDCVCLAMDILGCDSIATAPSKRSVTASIYLSLLQHIIASCPVSSCTCQVGRHGHVAEGDGEKRQRCRGHPGLEEKGVLHSLAGRDHPRQR